MAAFAVLALLLIAGLFFGRSQRVEPIRIGALHSLTGTMAVSEQPLLDAEQLAVEEINAAGGLLGHPVELVVADTHSDDRMAAREAARLIEREHVSALFACWTSACRQAVRPVVESHRHLMFYPVQYEGLEQSPNIIYTGAVPNQQIIPGTRWAIEHLGKRVYLLGSDYFFPRAANRIIRDVTHAASATILGERYLPLGQSDMAAVIADIRRLKPDVILNTINGDSNHALFAALRASELQKIPVMSFSVAEGELRGLLDESFHPNHYAVWSYFQSLPGKVNQTFVTRYRKRFGDQRVTSDPIVAAYGSVKLWANAVRETGSAEVEAVNRAVIWQSVATPAGPLVVDATTRHVWRSVRIGRANPTGQFEQVYASAEVRPAPFPDYRGLSEWRRMIAEIGDALPKGAR